MAERSFTGVPAAPGLAIGRARVLRAVAASRQAPIEPDQRPLELERATQAMAAAAAELSSLAERLRAGNRVAEAEIVETGVLMAEDVLDARAHFGTSPVRLLRPLR